MYGYTEARAFRGRISSSAGISCALFGSEMLEPGTHDFAACRFEDCAECDAIEAEKTFLTVAELRFIDRLQVLLNPPKLTLTERNALSLLR
jgi:hypothetical protein